VKSSGNTILVVGGTSGIGLGLAERWRENGNLVIVAGRSVDSVDGFPTLYVDVSDPESIVRARDVALELYPEINVLVSMSGIMLAEDLLDPGFLATAEATVEINLLGTIRTIAAFLPALTARPDAVIMTVSSGLASVPLPVTPTYNATKAAIHSFTESLRVQLSETGTQVIELVPPGVRTTLFGQEEAGSGMPLDEFLDEVMEILDLVPDVREVLVENVRYLRFAEANGVWAEAFGMLGGK
jgi:uncharacterized oxidoreductase